MRLKWFFFIKYGNKIALSGEVLKLDTTKYSIKRDVIAYNLRRNHGDLQQKLVYYGGSAFQFTVPSSIVPPHEGYSMKHGHSSD
jgi:hypothetical protein